MKLLLDSHALLWSIIKSDALSKNIIREIKDTKNQVFVSAVSLWEIALKYGLGKLVFESFDIRDIPRYCEQMGFELIPLLPQEALEYFQLPRKKKHKDPFDRMLIYQCIKNSYVLASRDGKMDLYREDGLKYIW
ncbi:twitching motility protein PilT [Spirochaetia bacterium]|nr:twitching motility protein PilT [Spirochaetia bacterium]